MTLTKLFLLTLPASLRRCSRVINDLNDSYTLQNDLTALHDWSKLWEMHFNLQKCKQLRVTKKKKPIHTNYHLGTERLLLTDQEKDLGIIMHHKLAWHEHIITKVNTANKILRLIRRTCGKLTQTAVICKLYIWSPHQAFLQDMIESVQPRRATRLMIKGKPYKERLQSLHLLSLKSTEDVVFLYKCLNGLLGIYCLSGFVDSRNAAPYNLRNADLSFKTR